MAKAWSRWRRFPDPRRGGMLVAPLGAGCYELRLGKEKILAGSGKNVALRMTSLLPKESGGAGTRRNSEKRKCVVENLSKIEYRTFACKDATAAKAFETRELKKHKYRFPT